MVLPAHFTLRHFLLQHHTGKRKSQVEQVQRNICFCRHTDHGFAKFNGVQIAPLFHRRIHYYVYWTWCCLYSTMAIGRMVFLHINSAEQLHILSVEIMLPPQSKSWRHSRTTVATPRVYNNDDSANCECFQCKFDPFNHLVRFNQLLTRRRLRFPIHNSVDVRPVRSDSDNNDLCALEEGSTMLA